MPPKVKTVLVGDAGVGKTCIAERIVKNDFNENTYATVGAANMTINFKTTKTEVTFNIWDTAGQERYRSLTPMYFAGSQVAILVFDITSSLSFKALDSFYNLLQQKAPADCVYFLVGNKSDLGEEKRQVTVAEAEAYKDKVHALFYMETSAATGSNIKELFTRIADSGMIVFRDDENDQYKTDFRNGNQKKTDCGC